MRGLLKRIVFTTLSLYIVTVVFNQVHFANPTALITMGIVLTLLNIFIRPFLSIILLPINLITFGLFSWMLSMIVLYIATLMTPGFSIGAIAIPSITISIFVFPAYQLTVFWSFFVVSFFVSLGNSLLAWIFT